GRRPMAPGTGRRPTAVSRALISAAGSWTKNNPAAEAAGWLSLGWDVPDPRAPVVRSRGRTRRVRWAASAGPTGGAGPGATRPSRRWSGRPREGWSAPGTPPLPPHRRQRPVPPAPAVPAAPRPTGPRAGRRRPQRGRDP